MWIRRMELKSCELRRATLRDRKSGVAELRGTRSRGGPGSGQDITVTQPRNATKVAWEMTSRGCHTMPVQLVVWARTGVELELKVFELGMEASVVCIGADIRADRDVLDAAFFTSYSEEHQFEQEEKEKTPTHLNCSASLVSLPAQALHSVVGCMALSSVGAAGGAALGVVASQGGNLGGGCSSISSLWSLSGGQGVNGSDNAGGVQKPCGWEGGSDSSMATGQDVHAEEWHQRWPAWGETGWDGGCMAREHSSLPGDKTGHGCGVKAAVRRDGTGHGHRVKAAVRHNGTGVVALKQVGAQGQAKWAQVLGLVCGRVSGGGAVS
ncbi:hypothetical protein B0H14DRAFT_2608201 [Mycena olivaceomarginata]|nr:hypothetical protein B0H14DRAFT_2608201 [Mycena olivaceomarginata]